MLRALWRRYEVVGDVFGVYVEGELACQADGLACQANGSARQAGLSGLGFDAHPKSKPKPEKPIRAGTSQFGKPKSELSDVIMKKRWEEVKALIARLGAIRKEEKA
ncbi:hypothetical protein C8F01DRAFT_1080823 [Mycena amicta]|nr:hypothetical protein C8F01DRAFT_1080823 [Mycena amicta]